MYDKARTASLVCEKIEKFRLFSGYTVFADGFNGFSKAQYNVLRVLAKTADKLVVTCPADDLSDADSRLFFRGVSMADILFLPRRTKTGLRFCPTFILINAAVWRKIRSFCTLKKIYSAIRQSSMRKKNRKHNPLYRLLL